jgi:Arc/MetJ family transcription regulator
MLHFRRLDVVDAVTKRLIDIDDALLQAAQRELRTSGISDTVRLVLEHVVAARARAREVERLLAGQMSEMATKEAREQAWRRSPTS